MVEIVPLSVRNLTFAGDLNVLQDNGAQYSGVDWQNNSSGSGDVDASDLGDRRFPIAYVRNSVVNVTALKMKTSAPPGYDIVLHGQGTPSLAGVPHYYGLVAKTASDSLELVGPAMLAVKQDRTAFVHLPNKVRFINPYTIDWELWFGGDSYADAGTTDNRFYVLLANTARPLYETACDISCKAANQYTDPAGVVGRIWAEFTDLDVRRKAMDGFNVADGDGTGVRMGYWRPPKVTIPQTLVDMLTHPTGNGSCVAWSELLIACIDAHTLGAVQSVILPDLSIHPLADGFLVKHWTFGTPGSGDFPYVIGESAIDGEGAPGQDRDNPPGGFESHYVVKYGGLIYDPSYGLGPLSELQHEDAAIDGFYDVDLNAREDGPGPELVYDP